jgi:hypothetical protein
MTQRDLSLIASILAYGAMNEGEWAAGEGSQWDLGAECLRREIAHKMARNLIIEDQPHFDFKAFLTACKANT